MPGIIALPAPIRPDLPAGANRPLPPRELFRCGGGRIILRPHSHAPSHAGTDCRHFTATALCRRPDRPCVGDALGTSVEFSSRGSFTPLTDMTGGGPFGLRPGQWTDDTSMALCLAQSLIYRNGFDPRDQMNRYVNWWQWGYLSATGECFDIGNTVRDALSRYEQTGDPFAGSTDPGTAGNGSLMRLAPVVLYFHPSRADVLHFAAESSRTTHAAAEAVECCILLAHAIDAALRGYPKEAVLDGSALELGQPSVAALARLAYAGKEDTNLHGSGYAVASLEAALWSFLHTDSFADAVLKAANLGDDADTTAAITGQLAGAFYGHDGIPPAWRERLHMHDEIVAMALKLGHPTHKGGKPAAFADKHPPRCSPRISACVTQNEDLACAPSLNRPQRRHIMRQLITLRGSRPV